MDTHQNMKAYGIHPLVTEIAATGAAVMAYAEAILLTRYNSFIESHIE